MDINTAKDIATIVAPLTNVVVSTYLKPKIEKFSEYLTRNRKVLEHKIINKFDDYLIRSYERQSYIRTVVFQNNQKLLHELYVPLTVVNPNSGVSVKIDSYPKKFLPEYNKILLVDTAGMGKSTISRYLFLKVIEENHGVPVFVELRQLKSGSTILELIHNDINKVDEVFDKNLLLKLLNNGDFIFFFDGFDEIPLKEREFATQHIQDFIAKIPDNKFLITSRQDNALTSFADFQRFVIRPLRQQEAYTLLGKYDPDGETSKSLIQRLEEYHRDTLKSFLINPLLVSLLFKAYEYKPTLPLRADTFYRQVYDALFENHDLSKGGSFIRQKNSGLNSEDFARVLRALAIKTVIIGKVQYTHDELLLYIKEAKDRCVGLTFSESEFVKDLIRNVPLFVEDGLDYRWNHKSFQEYFSAMFIAVDAKSSAERLLHSIVNTKEQIRFFNVLELYYDIDANTFQQSLVLPLFKDFIDYIKGESYNKKYDGVNIYEVSDRKLLCFNRRYIFFSTSVIDRLADDIIHDDSVKVHECIRSYCVNNNLINDDEVIGSSTHYPGGSGLVVICKYNVIIMEILNRKKHKSILDMRKNVHRSASEAYLNPNSVSSSLDVDILTDEIKNPLNWKSNFQKITKMLSYNDKVRISLQSDGCEKEIYLINKAIEQNNLNNLLNEL